MKRTGVSYSCILVFLYSCIVACETDSYDKGEGTYSHMTADFAEMWVNSQKQGVSFVTDEGQSYQLDKAFQASWMKTADSTYRTSIYYNKVDEGKASIVACNIMPTIVPKDPSKVKSQPQDPVDIESCWVSKGGKYMNLALLLKNGRNSDGQEEVHALAIILDETHKNADNTFTAYYRLLHDQGNAPEYYTNRRYASILLPATSRPDSVRLTVNTYDGTWVRTFKIP